MNRPDLSPARAARVAGAAYLVIILTGLFAELFARGPLLVAGDAAATATAVRADGMLLRLGIASDLVMLLADVVVAMALFLVFDPVSRALSLLAAFLRLVHAAVVGASLLNLLAVLLLLGGNGAFAALGQGQLEAVALYFFEAHANGYVIGLVFFGFQCLVLGWLLLASRYVPRWLGALVLVAGVGYLVDGFARVLLSDYAAHEAVFGAIVFVPAVIGEVSLCLWLLLRGIDTAHTPVGRA